MPKLSVNVVGLGGIGCCLVPVLARWLCFGYPGSTLVLIDDDEFEAGNATRQRVRIGQNKATALQKMLLEEGLRSLTIHARPERLDDSSIESHIKNGSITLLAVDNHPTRKLVSDFVESELTDAVVISGSNELEKGCVQIYVRRNGEDLTLPLAHWIYPEIAQADSLEAAIAGCGERFEQDPQLLITNNAVAAQMIVALYGCLTLSDPELYDETRLDVKTGNALSIDRKALRR